MSRCSYSKLKKLNYNGKVIKNASLDMYCTFLCGGKANCLVEVRTLENFLAVMDYITKEKLEYFVLGAGSNILVSDDGYKGIVIKFDGDLALSRQVEDTLIECGSGCKLSVAFAFAKSLNLSGLECGAGIPASIGGATYMNAGAYGFEMSKVVEYVVAYLEGKITYFHRKDCDFLYRHSVFQENKAIILRVGLRLQKSSKEEIESLFLETMKKRALAQPLEFPSAGSVFKKVDGLNVSKMLDDCGLKGLTLGDAQVSLKHANFIVNIGEATAQDIYYLIRIVQKRFKDRTGIDLTPEIKFLGEFNETTW